MLKKIGISFLSLLMLFSFILSGSISNVQAQGIEEPELKVLDVNSITNLDEALAKYGLVREDITSSFTIEDSQGVVNLYDSVNDLYVNFYINNEKVEYQSTQKELENGNVLFELFTFDLELALSEEITESGELVDKNEGIMTVAAKKPNKAALKWACIFSSFLACVSISAAAGAAGALVSGPFGVATGFTGGAACRYVFQTLVEKYGSKDQACKILS